MFVFISLPKEIKFSKTKRQKLSIKWKVARVAAKHAEIKSYIAAEQDSAIERISTLKSK